MKSIQVYDPAMCCSTGVCGPDVDPKLVQFASDLKHLQEQGVEVRRFNLAQSPAAFVEHEAVKTALAEKGEAALPLVFVGGTVVASGVYPTRETLVGALGLGDPEPSLFTPAVKELVAIGAAIASNCDPCLRFHVNQAEKLGVSTADIRRAVDFAAKVKDAPHRAVLRLAERLTQPQPPALPADDGSCGCGGNAAESDGESKACGCS